MLWKAPEAPDFGSIKVIGAEGGSFDATKVK